MILCRPVKVVFYSLALVGFALLVAGCGGAAKSSKSGSGSKSTGRTKSGSVSKRGKVAEQTRAVTLKRRGSWSLTSDKVKDVSPLVKREARKNDLPADLVYGIIWVESRFNPRAVSPVGARGLMQLMPKTAEYLADCIDWSGRSSSFDPRFNVAAGTYYIARLIKQFDGDEDLALAAYNAGPTKIRRWLKGSGLPKVSIEYATMVQTARGFFGRGKPRPRPARKAPGKPAAPAEAPVITDDELDRLGLAILIAGFSDKEFGLEREDDANPFD